MKELNSHAIKHVPSGLLCQRGQPGLQGLALEKWAAKTFLSKSCDCAIHTSFYWPVKKKKKSHGGTFGKALHKKRNRNKEVS